MLGTQSQKSRWLTVYIVGVESQQGHLRQTPEPQVLEGRRVAPTRTLSVNGRDVESTEETLYPV